MDLHELTRELHRSADTKIVLIVADGLGGLPVEPGGPTELESARTPNLDDLARRGTSGLLYPVLPGITSGSGPGHLSLFGYDPLQYRVGRGALSALGVDFDLQQGDVAARGNFCTVDEQGIVRDRRAGRIPDEEGRRIVEKLRTIDLDDARVFVEHEKQYRFAVIFRAGGLGDDVSDTDPQATDVPPSDPVPGNRESEKTARAVAQFVERALGILKDEPRANMILLRGFAHRPRIPSMREVYGLSAHATAVYPMYRGLARMLGMEVAEKVTGLPEQIDALRAAWDRHDFFFLHYKDTDSSGEDGDFERKAHSIERLDARIPDILEIGPDVLIVTGDHSTPSRLRSHSWHPVPIVLSAATCRPDGVERFGERDAQRGGLGHLEGKYLMPLALAHALRLEKFGA